MAFAPLAVEIRGNMTDLTHFGWLMVVDENSKVIYSVGDPDDLVFYRSASKPVQALPVIARGLDKKYGITEEESTIFAGSHAGEEFHVEALKSIFEKTGMREDMLVMKPAVPAYTAANEARIRAGLPPRKFYHNCAGKHAALMLLQRELTGSVEGYWEMGSACQLEVQRVIGVMSETDRVELGIDGCGVPVFAVPVQGIAKAFKNLAMPEKIADESLQQAAAQFAPRIHQYPHMMRGTDYLCTDINRTSNIVGKGGANGVYGFALKKEKLGVSIKIADGTEHLWGSIIVKVLRDLGCYTADAERFLEAHRREQILNDNGTLVGKCEFCFEFLA